MTNDMTSKSELIGWAYVRVSTVEQSNVLHGSVEQQLNRIKRWESEQSARTGIVHRITRFIDEDISGRAESLHKRREYHELIRAIKEKSIDFVVVEKLDRLHRNIIESRKFIDLCDSVGVKFYRLDGGLVDLKDRSSRTSVFIESWMAEEYSLDLVEKLTKKGREARVNNGKDNQSMPVLGLDEHSTEACFYVINQEEQRIVKDIFQHFCSSEDLNKTVQYCLKKDYRTKIRYTRPKVEKGKKVPPKMVGGESFDSRNLRALLVSRKIAGFGFFKDDWNQFPKLQDENSMVRWEYRHGPVIDAELFEKAQNILRKNRKHNHRIYENQRTYFLSGILFDADGNKFSGQSVKNKKNPYYSNSAKNYRVRADKIEDVVIKYVGTLLKENGILEKAIKNTFHEDNHGLRKLMDQLNRNAKETKQCEKLLGMLTSQGRQRMTENPEQMEKILLEGMEIRKQTQARLEELKEEAQLLNSQREQFQRFQQEEEVRDSLKKALDLFESSYSPRKKQLIQTMVPKLVLDEKTDRLHVFINPFLENLGQIHEEKFEDFSLFSAKIRKSGNFDPSAQVPETPAEILSQSEKKVCIATEWRNVRALCKRFFLHVKLIGITPFYIAPLFKNKFFLQQKYVIQGMSARQIAKEIFSSKMAVLSALKHFDIPIREPHYNHGNPSQPRFGKRFSKNYLVDDKVEQRVIFVVRELREQGFSLRKIAKILNDMRVATKCYAKSWHPEMIRRIIDYMDPADG